MGDSFVLYKGLWTFLPDDVTPLEHVSTWNDILKNRLLIVGPCPLGAEQLNRLVNNVLVALTQRPEGITVTERSPSARAARKRGRRYYPGVEYVIGSTTPLWKPDDRGQAINKATPKEPPEGWTLSVRTMVRGHWRRQAVGLGLLERRVTWVRPHWRGPADAPISAHATRFIGKRPDDDGGHQHDENATLCAARYGGSWGC